MPMKSIFAAALAITGTASVALADEPVTLTDAQMDAVTAGQFNVNLTQVAVAVSSIDNSSTGDVAQITTAANIAAITLVEDGVNPPPVDNLE